MELIHTERRISGEGIIPRNGTPRLYHRIIGTFLCPYCGQTCERKVSIGLKLKRCGCVPNGTKHGLKGDPVYNLWKRIRVRCYDPNYPEFHLYGGRGIVMCEAWRLSPVPFVLWARANGWSPALQIDRINNSAGYSPDNCRFTTAEINSQNSRQAKLNAQRVRRIRQMKLVGMKTKTIASEFGVTRKTIHRVVKIESWKNIL